MTLKSPLVQQAERSLSLADFISLQQLANPHVEITMKDADDAIWHGCLSFSKIAEQSDLSCGFIEQKCVA